MKTFWLYFLLIPVSVTAQVNISGTVTEAGTNKPIPYATIYINGTTNGTITNVNGEFILEDVVPPCEIVFSHISYSTEAFELQEVSDTVFHIQLKPRDVELGAVEVTDKNRREENLRHFREQFLGTDDWGKNAYFENDSVLLFRHRKIAEGDSSFLSLQDDSPVDTGLYWFVVETKEPLVVNQPLLGYKIHINLVKYNELRRTNSDKYRIQILGYFFFQPLEGSLKRKTNRFQKNRAKAYYNSANHFCRSLYNNRLKENGYKVYYRSVNQKTGINEFKDFEFDDHIIYDDNQAKIVGLKNVRCNIDYFQLFNKPMNLNEREGGRQKYSSAKFLKDTCTIRADGSRPDNSILFSYSIGEKRVGAMLPYDYQPE